jgi:plastocyanin
LTHTAEAGRDAGRRTEAKEELAVPRRVVASLAPLGAVVVLAAAAPAQGKPIKVGDNYFSPTRKTVRQHTTVTWKFVGEDAHNVTVKRGPVKFSSPTKVSGRFSRHMMRKGTYKIVCSIHEGRQKMTLEVV